MNGLLEWLQDRIIKSRGQDSLISTGEYFAYVKVHEYVLKNYGNISQSDKVFDNHDWVVCPRCDECSCKSQWSAGNGCQKDII